MESIILLWWGVLVVGGFLFSFASWLWWSSTEVMLIEFEPIVANILIPIISVCGSERSSHTLLMIAHLQLVVQSPTSEFYSVLLLCVYWCTKNFLMIFIERKV